MLRYYMANSQHGNSTHFLNQESLQPANKPLSADWFRLDLRKTEWDHEKEVQRKSNNLHCRQALIPSY